jgi:hypothetical protein
MFTFDADLELEEEFLARVTEIAYQAILKQGLRRPFLEVELELWREIRAAYHAQEPRPELLTEVA